MATRVTHPLTPFPIQTHNSSPDHSSQLHRQYQNALFIPPCNNCPQQILNKKCLINHNLRLPNILRHQQANISCRYNINPLMWVEASFGQVLLEVFPRFLNQLFFWPPQIAVPCPLLSQYHPGHIPIPLP